MPSHHEPGNLELSRRRQNKSCDQCRAGKRRCDVQLNVRHGSPIVTSGLTRLNSRKPSKHSISSSCTNCVRWKKRCTIEWIKSRETQSTSCRGSRQQENFATAGHDIFDQELSINSTWDSRCNGQSDFLLHDYSLAPSVCETFFDHSRVELQSLSGSDSSNPFWDSQTYFEDLQNCQPDSNISVQLAESNETATKCAIDHESELDLHFTPSFGNDAANTWEQDRQVKKSTVNQTFERESDSDGYYSTIFRESEAVIRTPSPFTSQLLGEDYNRVSIKKGLLKIYHDSLEGALSCWLTERNCPYTSTVFDSRDAWSSNWANRIVTRVCALDKAYVDANMVPRHDQQQAAQVLNLVMMAFAAQWSQTAQPNTSRLPLNDSMKLNQQRPRSASRGEVSLEQLEHDPFGRNMQKSLWEQANKALGEASNNMSFRVIFAGIIFALTQRPIDGTDTLQNLESFRKDDIALLYKILDLDGPPIVLDVALRKLHDHHRKLEDAQYATGDGAQASEALRKLPVVHRETFRLLYWLAVMFDTLSAAVNRRSFTVCDTDSDIGCYETPIEEAAHREHPIDLDGWSGYHQITSRYQPSPLSVWGNYFLRQKSQVGDQRKQTIRWPCSYVDAASCLADAAPVKVLLFRRVGQLQGLSYQRSSAEAIETGIDAAMEVYRHWNNTYGRFIEDCIVYHESLPTRIQSWYILLAGHWNLAILILVDLIDKFDKMCMTKLFNRRARQSTEWTQTIRMQAAFAVSDLGRNSQSERHESSFSRAPDFHHAVNQVALLTEPWTMVLVRSFGHAGAVLARQVLSLRETDTIGNALEARKRLQYCINALRLLGKKSDMATYAAQVLLQAVD